MNRRDFLKAAVASAAVGIMPKAVVSAASPVGREPYPGEWMNRDPLGYYITEPGVPCMDDFNVAVPVPASITSYPFRFAGRLCAMYPPPA